MVAYRFQARFTGPISQRTKRQTLRNERKRHARAGEEIQLFAGSRYQPIRLGVARALVVEPIEISFAARAVVLPTVVLSWRNDRERFARLDGFESWDHLVKFWAENHPEAFGRGSWSGIRISWGETFAAAPAS